MKTDLRPTLGGEVILAPILATKLFVPPPPPRAVSRGRLVERLDAGLAARRKLTLISAPAGFGKTTLAAAWLAGAGASTGQDSGRRAAWVSLDEHDGDPIRFLAYVTRALQTAVPGFGAGILASLQAPQPPATEAVLTTLVNELAALDATAAAGPTILVLDDYHAVASREVDAALTFLVEHLPPQLHLAVTTREDPALPLPRLRARNQLTELRAADLRFTPTEAAAFLNGVMALGLTADEVATLESRTEGWIAGLQLAALSMQGRADVTGFIQAFAGDHRYIVDYLVEEVLARQSPDVRSFLLQTAILEQLHGPLCDALTGHSDGQARLEALQRGNFFVVPLDDTRRWYRYHHLFGDVLRVHLLAECPEAVPALHRRAGAWYRAQGMPDAAIRHTLAGEDFEGAAELIELGMPDLRRTRQEATMLRWLGALPPTVIGRRPVLSLHYAGALLLNGEYGSAETRLNDAERLLAAEPAIPSGDTTAGDSTAGGMIVVDEAEYRRVPGWIALYRAAIALAQGDAMGTVHYAELARARLAVDDHLGRGAAAGLLGLAAWTREDLAAAHQYYVECKAGLLEVGYISDALGCTVTLTDIRLAQGRLHDAMRHLERGLELGRAGGGSPVRGTADMLVGMSELARERNDLPAAQEYLRACAELGEFAGLPQNRYRRRLALARLRAAEGDAEGAIELLAAAERVYMGDLSPNVRPLAAWKARVWVSQGRLAEARAWAEEQGLAAAGEISYLREFEYMTLARVLLAQFRLAGDGGALLAASGLLARLRQAAEAGGRIGNLIEILVLEALARQGQDDLPGAQALLARALALAEPQGYVRLFVDEGPPLGALLRATAQAGTITSYVEQILDALGAAAGNPAEGVYSARTVAGARPAEGARPAPLVEPLSERELEVLRLLGTEMSGPEIADTLYVSLNTLRTHTKNIYGKLGANSRRSAVRRAEELRLL